MIVTWQRYLARRGVKLQHIVKSYGLNYEGVVAYFGNRGAVPPNRLHPEIVELFGEPSPTVDHVKVEPASDPVPSPPKKKVKKLEVSIKNTKKELLEIAERLQMMSVSSKLTKAKILDELGKSEKIRVLKVQTNKKVKK